MKRRDFLKKSAIATGLILVPPLGTETTDADAEALTQETVETPLDHNFQFQYADADDNNKIVCDTNGDPIWYNEIRDSSVFMRCRLDGTSYGPFAFRGREG